VRRRSVFIDTFALVALASKTDQHHRAAVQMHSELRLEKCTIITSQWVLAEFLGWSTLPSFRAAALHIVDSLRGSPRVIVLGATPDQWDLALRRYRDRPDKGWSLIDCISMDQCAASQVSDVFTNDHHFTQAGLSILLPS
jgi:uncharacterized protein